MNIIRTRLIFLIISALFWNPVFVIILQNQEDASV